MEFERFAENAKSVRFDDIAQVGRPNMTTEELPTEDLPRLKLRKIRTPPSPTQSCG
jgi:hypothetical protein